MATYTYSPSIATKDPYCYRWNLVQRIKGEVIGTATNTVLTSVSDIGEETWVEFSAELTAAQKTALDTLMASANPCDPPSSGVVVVSVKDIWGGEDGANFEAFKVAVGCPQLRLFYDNSDPLKPEIIDVITMWNPVALTNTQKNAIKSEFGKLILVK